jgi:two-component system sensor histidine kinase QseC
MWSLAVAAIGLAVACVAVVRWIVARELRPVEQVAAQAILIGPETLDLRFDVASLPAELKPICLRLNDLLGRLDQAFRRERRINADIAHELRTPIAELRSLTEVASLWPGDERQMSVYLRDAHDVAVRMESIVEQLLALARSHAGRILPKPEEFDLNDLIGDLIEHFRCAAETRNVELDYASEPGLMIRTDRMILSQVVNNLIANAIEYSPASGRVECRIFRGRDAFELTISNINTSLTEDDLPKLFEPFWRKDGSRTDGAHSGLGLALVRELARQLGFVVSASLPAPDRIEMTLKMPTAIPASTSAVGRHLPVIIESAK